MRNVTMLAGAALLLAACGGEPAADANTSAEAPAAAPAAAGATHDVNMVQEGTEYKFVPAELTIKIGDVVNFHNVSGGPHNVQFFPDSIPADAAAPLDAGMPGDKLGEVTGPLLTEPNAVYSIAFNGVPAGEYKFTCLPHMAVGMHGKVTISQ